MPIVGYGVFRMPAVQRWLTGKIVNYLTEKLHTKVTLQGLDISIFDHLILEKLLSSFYQYQLHVQYL